MRLLKDAVSIILSASLLALAFPAYDLHYLAWIALVPLFLRIGDGGPWRSLLLSLAAGYLFYTAHLWWSLRLDGMNPFNFALGNLGNAWYFGAFGITAWYFQKAWPRWNPLTLPAAWVALEYVRSHIGFLSAPWGMLGYSQYSFFPAAKISTYAGVYGVSFLIVAANAALSDLVPRFLYSLCGKEKSEEIPQGGRRVSFGILALVLVSLSASFLSGALPAEKSEADQGLKVSLVQGNMSYEEQSEPFPIYRELAFEKYRRLTMESAGAGPDLVVWPSSSVPGRLPSDGTLRKMLSDIARETGAYFLIGTAGFDKFNEKQRKEQRVANSAFLFSPAGNIAGRYDKMRLLPFDEYLPFREYFTWPSWIATPDMTDHLPGKEMTIFRMDRSRFGVLICWENLFPDQFREMSSRGVDFMVSMTNEGFTLIPEAHYQLLAIYMFRAIENHVAIVRTDTKGVSCIINPNGRITARVQDRHGNDVNVEGYLVGEVPLSPVRTFYNRYGDWFVYMVFLLLAGLVLAGERKRRSKRTEREGKLPQGTENH
jgi:apolipoprotein N-acyltransferase